MFIGFPSHISKGHLPCIHPVPFLPEPGKVGGCAFRAVGQSRPDAVGTAKSHCGLESASDPSSVKADMEVPGISQDREYDQPVNNCPQPVSDPDATSLPEPFLPGQIA